MQLVFVRGKGRQAVEDRASSVAAGVVYDQREGKPVAETRAVVQCETAQRVTRRGGEEEEEEEEEEKGSSIRTFGKQ